MSRCSSKAYLYVVPLNTKFIVEGFFKQYIIFFQILVPVSLPDHVHSLHLSSSLILFMFNTSLSNFFFFNVCGLVAFLEFRIQITVSLEADSIEAKLFADSKGFITSCVQFKSFWYLLSIAAVYNFPGLLICIIIFFLKMFQFKIVNIKTKTKNEKLEL